MLARSAARRRSLGGLLVLAVLVAGGCATSPAPAPSGGEQVPHAPPAETPVAEGATPGGPTPSETTPSPTPRPSTEGATLALLQQSERAAENGSLDEALSYVERAVRIEPRRADLWTRLASLELTAGNPNTAIQYARKALSLAGDRADWQRDAWLVIADARDALGEHAEADAIRERWRTARG